MILANEKAKTLKLQPVNDEVKVRRRVVLGRAMLAIWNTWKDPPKFLDGGTRPDRTTVEVPMNLLVDVRRQ